MITDLKLNLGSRRIGDGEPAYVIAEIGINHNGSLDLAKRLIDVAVDCGCDAVKFQKRTPDLCVPREQRDLMRETPWGPMTYIDYRHRVEFDLPEYQQLDQHCRKKGIAWFASCWDAPSVDFINQFDVPCHKIASATITDTGLLSHIAAVDRPVILSTGMSTMDEIDQAAGMFPQERLVITHSTSTYPCAPEELNLRLIPILRQRHKCLVGYSGHETGLQTTCAAVVLGACVIERHVTLDRAMWGSDHAASLEPGGLQRLVRDIRVIEQALGDGIKRVYDSEKPIRARLRAH